MLPSPKFMPGDNVLIRGSVQARIERVIYAANCVRPFYKVEWWHEGQPNGYEVEEIDLSEAS